MKPTLFLAVSLTLVAIPMLSQAPSETKPAFEVASVKASDSLDNSYITGSPGGRYVAVGVPIRMVIRDAFRLRPFQIVGGPDWTNTDRWDIEAKPKEEDAQALPAGPPDPTRPSRGNLMVQSLLEDRFQLKTHRETRELPVYELTVAKGGPKIKASAGVPEGRPRMRAGRGNLEAYQMPLSTFAFVISPDVDRLVLDKTGMPGLFDFKLTYSPTTPAEGAPPSDVPSIFTAIQEQLGLKLESAKGPVEVLVIDSMQKPTSN
jgi:uncharacterized protein (TIGR03435 family)